MKFTTLGNTGITVSRLCLGCMSYGGGEMPAWAQGTRGWHVNKEDAREHFRIALEIRTRQGQQVQEIQAVALRRHQVKWVEHDDVLTKISDELVFHRSALEDLRRLVAAQKLKSPRMDVAKFKELTGVSRKYAIPLLEYLDRERVTKRVGDAREIL